MMDDDGVSGMASHDVGTLLHAGAGRLGVELGQHAIRMLERYCGEVFRWNRRVNLVARQTSMTGLAITHFLDAMSPLPLLRRLVPGNRFHLLDVGSGAGFPGLVLAILQPDWQITLVEPRQKRAVFLRHVVRLLELTNVELVRQRVEQVRTSRFAAVDCIISRAVAQPAVLLPLVAHLVTGHTRVVFMHGATGCRNWRRQPVAGFELQESQSLVLPFSDACRTLLVVGRKTVPAAASAADVAL